ncbi:MAG: S8 family serine peptidase, partial [Myxococcales bacterium]
MPLVISSCTAADNQEARDGTGAVGTVKQAVSSSEKATAWNSSTNRTPYQEVVAAQQQAKLAFKRPQKTVWVKMKQKPSLAAAAASKDWTTRGKQVHSVMTSTASSSQASLVAYLAAEKIQYKAFWIANAIKIKADEDAIAAIAKRSDVERIVPDGGLTIAPPKRSSLQIVPQAVEWNIENVRAPEVWKGFGVRGEGVVVATIDTGVEYTHAALVNQYRGNNADGSFDHNYNWNDPAQICGDAPCDNAGHGTHTMGTILGDDGGENQIGVAPGARWIAAKGCEDYYCSYESLLGAGQWIVAPTDLSGQNPRPEMRPHVVSNSWGGGQGDEFFREIVQAWVASGIVPVFANGNSGPSCGSASSPADYPESYAVGAYNSRLSIADFSSRGPAINGDMKPNIAAPGEGVRSSVPGGYDIYDGTSMATPHVAGAVALMLSRAPALVGDVAGTRAILNESAIDTDDTSCGGTPEFNASFGEGRLDAYRAVELSPGGPIGTLAGAITETSGPALPGAKVALQGPLARSTVAGVDGIYSIKAPVGFYSVTASQFAFYSQTVNDVEVVQDVTTTQNFALERAPSFGVTGVVRDEEGEPVQGATVTFAGTPIKPALTDATGAFAFESVPAGEYQLTVTAGGCLEPFAGPLVVDSDESVPVTMDARVDGYGYTCRLVPMDYIKTDTPLGLQGEGVTAPVKLPFSFMMYGKRFENAIVGTAGYLSFSGAAAYWDNLPIPDPSEPNAAVFPFWDDNYMDGQSSAGTAVVGTAPNRKFVMEWRNVAVDFDLNKRITFELVLSEATGEVLFQYLDSDSTGNNATIGIENETGTIGHQYSYNKPAISAGMAIQYGIPHAGVAEGVITDQNDGLAVKNAEVVAIDSTGRTLKTATDDLGRYAFQTKAGSYALTVNETNY